MEAFDLLNKKLQKVIHEMKWESFRPIQNEAILHLIGAPSDVILSAQTAGGKTEAACLPIISQIADSGKNAVKIVYISPLKALINDQFARIEALCKNLDFPITKWHGDASASRKAKLIDNPAGILLITPESIESLFLNRTEYLKSLFGSVEYIVIDEIHSFIGNERGTQLRSLMNRIEYITGTHPYKIALSATISNIDDIAKWLNPDNSSSVKIIEDEKKTKETAGIIKCYESALHDEGGETKKSTKDAISPIKQDLFNVLKQGKNLIFANSKMVLEEYCDAMQNIAEQEGLPNTFYIHHGSLAKNIREESEHLLKTKNNISVFCTSTLELGIDIGNIDRVVFLAPPFSVASLTQRLGRSGRKKNTRKEFRFFLEENAHTDNVSWQDKLRIQLIQSIAIVELMMQGFSEPLNTTTFDYSTFVHQILSYLGQTGGANASELYHVIGEVAFNSAFSKKDFIEILQNLYAEKIIYQLPDKTICLAQAGEKIVENYEFYAAFSTQKEWKVLYNNREIGQLTAANILFLEEGANFLLAGKRWEIIEIKKTNRIIIVKKAQAKKSLKFSSSAQNIHQAVQQKMLEIYQNNFTPKYLSKNSLPILQEAFEIYNTDIAPQGSNILPVFEGSRIQNTIGLLLKQQEIDVENIDIGFFYENGKQELIHILKAIDFSSIDKDALINLLDRSLKYKKKFDHLLPDAILNKSYEQECLDFEGAQEFVEKLSAVTILQQLGINS